MLLKVFAVRDLKASAFLQPFVSNSNGSAIRTFGDACVEEKSIFNKHPEDFMLFEIGTYEDNSGLLTPLTPVSMICAASDFISAKSNSKSSQVSKPELELVTNNNNE